MSAETQSNTFFFDSQFSALNNGNQWLIRLLKYVLSLIYLLICFFASGAQHLHSII